MKNKLFIFIALLSLSLASCDLGNDPDVGGTATKGFNGEYYVQLLEAPGGAALVDYTKWTISNTAANTADKIQITDNDNVWGFKGKFNCNVPNLTFSGEAIPNPSFAAASEPDPSPYQPIGTIDTVGTDFPKFMTITDGAVFQGAAHVPSKTVADSIAFSATGIFYAASFKVVSYAYDTTSIDPLVIDTLNVFQFVEEFPDYQDGPYFITGFKRTGFREDEH